MQSEAAKEATRRWRLKNPDKVLAMRLRYRLKHRAEIRIADVQYRSEHPDKRRAANKKYYRENVEKLRSDMREYSKRNGRKLREAHPEKVKARNALNGAVRYKKLIRQDCWCGERGQAHHDDYSKPLEVKWLCIKHHAELHRIYK